MKEYIVVAGDTLYGISKQTGVSIAKLKEYNNLNDDIVILGQVLKIPQEVNTTSYTVLKGDSLYSIAKKFDTTVETIKKLNNLETNILQIGKILQVPSLEEESKVYQVEKGDSLYSIASKFNTTVDLLKTLNNLTTNMLQIGQILQIPQEDEEIVIPIYTEYKVVSGDSLYSIAKKFSMTVDEIKKLNNLTTNTLQIGQTLKLKIGNEEIGVLECFGSSYVEPTYQIYTVVKGDSLYKIANKFDTTTEELIALNSLKNTALSIGQQLKVK